MPVPAAGLLPVLQWARQAKANIDANIADCSAVLVFAGASGGKLCDYESVFIKVRHRPLSIYAYVLKAGDRKGEEAIYVEGRNGGKLLAHTTGITGKLTGTVALDPKGTLAMDGQHHPLTELGILDLCQRVISLAESDMRDAECQVRFLHGVKVADRPCTLIEVMHPAPRPTCRFHVMRVFVDEQLNVPIRFELYDWPKQPARSPSLWKSILTRISGSTTVSPTPILTRGIRTTPFRRSEEGFANWLAERVDPPTSPRTAKPASVPARALPPSPIQVEPAGPNRSRPFPSRSIVVQDVGERV